MSGENMAKKMGQGKQIRGALERLDSIEELLPQMMTQINRAVTVLENNIQSLNEIVEAVVVCVGEEQVDAALPDNEGAGGCQHISPRRVPHAAMGAS